jgi:hypothetical protein
MQRVCEFVVDWFRKKRAALGICFAEGFAWPNPMHQQALAACRLTGRCLHHSLCNAVS